MYTHTIQEAESSRREIMRNYTVGDLENPRLIIVPLLELADTMIQTSDRDESILLQQELDRVYPVV